jgi:predicted permease
MYWLRRLLLLLPGRRAARERELREELDANLTIAIDESSDPRIARRDFGNLTRAQEEARSVWLPGWDALSQDVRFALRTLRRAPVFTTVAVLSLALGTGAAAALFSLVDTVVLKPLSYREPGRLVVIREVVPPLAHIYPTVPVNIRHFRYWREHAQSFESLTAAASETVAMDTGGEPVMVGGVRVTADLFRTLGVQPQLGRVFWPEDETITKNRPVVITDGLWRRLFGGTRDVIGKTVRLDAAACPIVGVLPAGFRFPKKSELGPLTGLPEHTEIFLPLTDTGFGWGGDYDYIVFGRLRQGVAPAQGKAELNAIETRIAEEHKLNAGLHTEVRPLQEVMASPVRTGLAVLLAAVLLLVLIVCVNLANLLLARGGARAREFSLRIALGASRGRLLAAAVTETILIACAGGALGLVVSRAALAAFVRTAPIDLPRLDEVQVDTRVLLFAIALTLLCGVLFGLLPAMRLTRYHPQTALRGEGHTLTGSRARLRLREWLVGSEVALSTVLLVLAGLLVNSLWHVLRVDRGFTVDQAIDIRLDLPARYRPNTERAAFFDRTIERLRGLPGVRSVAAASKVPLTGESNVNHVLVKDTPEGALDPRTRELVMVNVRFVSQDYFSSLGIPVVRGRAIEPRDRERKVAVISERLAAKLWPREDPIGKVLSSGSGVNDAEVIGVVGDVHSTRLERDPTLMIYIPFWPQAHQVSGLVVRAAGEPRGLTADLRRVIHEMDPGIPAPKMRTMGEIIEESVAQRRFQMRLSVAFAMFALLLAALGIYGVVAYGITLRRRELGIRMALGARAAEVRRLVVSQGLRPVVLGLCAGLMFALVCGRLVGTLLFGVTPADGATLAAVAVVLGVVATLACLMPAQSAARIDPARVLRDE